MATKTIDQKLSDAEQALAKIRAEAEAEAERKAAEDAQREADYNNARDKFEAQRYADLPRVYGAKVREARDAFHAAVAAGQEPFKAWTEWHAAAAVQAAESARIVRWQHGRRLARYESVLERVRDLSRRLLPYQGIGTLPADEAPAELVAINAAWNDLAAEVGSDHRRDPGDTAGDLTPLTLDLVKPSLPMSTGERGDWSPRAFLAALTEAAEGAADQAARDHTAGVLAELDTLTD